jgi:hypothetical protein
MTTDALNPSKSAEGRFSFAGPQISRPDLRPV